ncbi:hypothetical protein RBA41_14205 [Massilia sp. CCM 9210]|uniref:hypothetical protein n=1 Tax=Massilia scottii TaxID=3057166 RepID=UPI0027967BE9|nr:hypothetical protein [Massilia sp. CCM 9210]MDQ1814460.1 hypothetical protein [Massilia sp. CCM 9210]
MITIFDQPTWERLIKGFTIYDCAIFREHGFSFILVEEKDDRDTLPLTRFLTMAIDKPMENRFSCTQSDKYGFTTIAVCEDPLEYVAVDTSSNVFSVTKARTGSEKPIEDVIDMLTYGGSIGIVKKVVRAAGQIYALGDYRKIYRRIGIEQWIELGKESKGLPIPAEVLKGNVESDEFGFVDLSAFSANDMYAVGGEGDVWRFDGVKWHNCPLPTNAYLQSVCCAGDGLVYITEMNGSVWAGRTDSWKRVANADINPGHQPVDAFWFNDRLYLGAQQGIFTIDSKKKEVVPLQSVERDAPNPTNGGRLDLSPDGKFLLTAGPYGACLNDGTGWRRLFSAFDYP